jgi:hypothetical protein
MASDSKTYYDANPKAKAKKNAYMNGPNGYNKTKKGKDLIKRAQKLRRQLIAQGKLKKGSKTHDAGHYNKNPNSNSGRAQLRSKNRNRYA